jgi:hypothetical protein
MRQFKTIKNRNVINNFLQSQEQFIHHMHPIIARLIFYNGMWLSDASRLITRPISFQWMHNYYWCNNCSQHQNALRYNLRLNEQIVHQPPTKQKYLRELCISSPPRIRGCNFFRCRNPSTIENAFPTQPHVRREFNVLVRVRIIVFCNL